MMSRKVVWRVGVIAGAAVLIAGSLAVVCLRRKAPDRDDPAARTFLAAPFSSSGPAVAGRSRALAALRDGRFDQAMEFYQGLPENAWQAEDCVALGRALLERDRVGLGRAALEAARRIDEKHPATAAALETFGRKRAALAGRERTRLQEAVSRVEPLRSIPSGPSLGLLVLALARYATSPLQEEEFLDRIRARYLASVRGLHTRGDAMKTAARLLLETGRAGEARELLDPFVMPAAPGRVVADGPAADREAAWLLSRAALGLGAHETADAMLAMAGDFGKSAGGLVEPSPFAGSRRCGECHRSIYRAQQRESRHAQTLRFGSQLKDVPLPSGPIADRAIAGLTHSFNRKNDHEIQIESRSQTRVFPAIIEYAVGSGRHGITMLARDEDGIARELRISYSGLDGTWVQTKGIEFAPQQPGDHIGVGLGRKEVNHCISCHATWFRSVDPDRSGPRPPEGEDRGIGCERCHGPGSNHVLAAASGFAEMAITLTARTRSRAA